MLTSILYTASQDTPEVGHRLCTSSRPPGEAPFGRPAFPLTGCSGRCLFAPVPHSTRSLLPPFYEVTAPPFYEVTAPPFYEVTALFLVATQGSFYSRNTNLLSYVSSVFSPSPPVHFFAFCHQLKKTKKTNLMQSSNHEGL